MKTVKLSNLKEGDIFSYKGIVYEIYRCNKWDCKCKYVNDVINVWGYTDKYLYTSLSKHLKVEI